MAAALAAPLDRQQVRFDIETAARQVLGADFDLEMVPSDPKGLAANLAAWWGNLREIARRIRALPAGYFLHDPTADEAKKTRSKPLGETLSWLTDVVMEENAV